MPSRISGIGLAGIQRRCWSCTRRAFAADVVALPIGGFYRYRRGGETPRLGSQADPHAAARGRDRQLSRLQALRGGDAPSAADLAPRPARLQAASCAPIPLDEVESITEIRKRFVTPGMSLGALSPEAHETLTIAMNRIGAKSDCGEGGEDPARYQPRANGDNANSRDQAGGLGPLRRHRRIPERRAASSRSRSRRAPSPARAASCPASRSREMIARLRHATPGVTLISPPPHHDIYSIEDLAQLIYDLKQINPDARVCVKLVVRARHRHHRGRRRQGQGRRDPGLRPCRRHRRLARRPRSSMPARPGRWASPRSTRC